MACPQFISRLKMEEGQGVSAGFKVSRWQKVESEFPSLLEAKKAEREADVNTNIYLLFLSTPDASRVLWHTTTSKRMLGKPKHY